MGQSFIGRVCCDNGVACVCFAVSHLLGLEQCSLQVSNYQKISPLLSNAIIHGNSRCPHSNNSGLNQSYPLHLSIYLLRHGCWASTHFGLLVLLQSAYDRGDITDNALVPVYSHLCCPSVRNFLERNPDCSTISRCCHHHNRLITNFIQALEKRKILVCCP